MKSSIYYEDIGRFSNPYECTFDWERDGTVKNSKFEKTYAKRCVNKVIHEFSFLQHPWTSEVKFLLCNEHILRPLYLMILQPYERLKSFQLLK